MSGERNKWTPHKICNDTGGTAVYYTDEEGYLCVGAGEGKLKPAGAFAYVATFARDLLHAVAEVETDTVSCANKQERLEIVKRLFEQDKAYAAIAERVGYSLSTVKRDLKELGLSRRKMTPSDPII